MLELKNITKSFGDAHVLNGISLTLDKGRIMSILGPSGGGKTTLLNIILGITDATGGQILFDGEDLTRVPMEKRGFNIVFQDYALFPNLNAYENIIEHPASDFVRDFILHQLEVKRNNIYSLFSEDHAADARREPALVGA